MRVRWQSAVWCALAVCLSASALGNKGASRRHEPAGDDIRLFHRALRDSYDGKHAVAREEFREYQERHPDDMLVPVRVLYDHLFDVHDADMDRGEYRALLAMMNAAISRYARVGCAGTDLQGIGNGTLDCNYVGAALYSSREALYLAFHGTLWRLMHKDLIGADDRRFFFYVHQAHPSAQTMFLEGLHEYEASNSGWSLVLKMKNIPASTDDALRIVLAAFEDKSPFADDIWFFALRTELERKPGAERIERIHPPAEIIARLQQKYPDNRIFNDGLTSSFKDPFASY